MSPKLFDELLHPCYKRLTDSVHEHNCKIILSKGTKETVESAVKYAIKTAGPGGGFFISASNMHPAVRVQNLQWMVEATHKYGNSIG